MEVAGPSAEEHLCWGRGSQGLDSLLLETSVPGLWVWGSLGLNFPFSEACLHVSIMLSCLALAPPSLCPVLLVTPP